MNCAVCGKPIKVLSSADELDDFTIDGKPVHEDCYYKKLGEEVEQFPPASRRPCYGTSAD